MVSIKQIATVNINNTTSPPFLVEAIVKMMTVFQSTPADL